MHENTSFCLIEPLDISHATHNELPLSRLDLEKHFFFFFWSQILQTEGI